MWSGCASLHRDEERLSGLWGRFSACSFCVFACTSHAVSASPGLVKLLALSNFPAFVHYCPCFTGLYGQCCFSLGDSLRHRCFLLLDRSGTALSSLTHSFSQNQFVLKSVWLIRFIVLANDRESQTKTQTKKTYQRKTPRKLSETLRFQKIQSSQRSVILRDDIAIPK